MSELNRDQKVKALECCTKAQTHGDCIKLNCPALVNYECIYNGEDDSECMRNQLADILSLVKELTEDAANWRIDAESYLKAEQIKGCEYCTPKETGHGRIKYSYDDTDGMTMCIHPSPLRKDGTRSLSWWATVNFRGYQRDFLIECCPFCGKRLVPKKEDIGETPYGI